jgi:hypothetical protein
MWDDPTAALAVVEPGLRPKEDGVGVGGNEAQYLREDVPKAHLFPGPNCI